MLGNEISPIVTTVAPTMPVLAANNMPTITTDNAKPPGMPRINKAMLCNRVSAILDFSSNTPIITNSGTAIKVMFCIMPNKREGMAKIKPESNTPWLMPKAANPKAVPAKVKATGKPNINNKQMTENKYSGIYSMMILRGSGGANKGTA